MPVIKLSQTPGKSQELAEAADLRQDRIRFNCPECGNRVKAKYGQGGRPFHCPFCSKVSTVPIPSKPLLRTDEKFTNTRRLVLWLSFLALLGITYSQQRLWMPVVGLRPPPIVEQVVPEAKTQNPNP